MNTNSSSNENYDFADVSPFITDETTTQVVHPGSTSPWKIFVIDDDDEVHRITRIVLGDLVFEGRPLLFLHSYSSFEAFEIFQANPDIAVALVDVVMDTDDAGLRLVEQVRNELGNSFVRLILRTGQAGLAPERDVVIRYDINDYKEKTELSSEKLCTAVISALRSYRDIVALDTARQGMERMVSASEALFRARTIYQFTEIILPEALRVMGISESLLSCRKAGGMLVAHDGAYFVPETICATAGSCVQTDDESPLSPICITTEALRNQADLCVDECVATMILRSSFGDEFHLRIELPNTATNFESSLLELFRLKANSALERLVQHEKTREAQRQAIRALAKVREQNSLRDGSDAITTSRCSMASTADLVAITGDCISAAVSPSPDFFCQLSIQAEVAAWGNPERAAAHVLRVSRYAYHLGKLCGSDDSYCVALLHAARLHDIGNLFVGPYHYCAWSESNMESRDLAVPHTTTGSQFLSENEQATLLDTQLSVEITRHHHEAWDGRGYPDGLSGEQIPLSARIVAVADFFDTATHSCATCDKSVNQPKEAFEMLAMAAGFLFDPKIVDLFLSNQNLLMSARDEVNQSFFMTKNEN